MGQDYETATGISYSSIIYGLEPYNSSENDSVFSLHPDFNATLLPDDGLRRRDGLPGAYTLTRIISASVIVIIVVFGIIFGNALVCIAIAKDRNLKSTQNWFIACLAVADLLIGLIIIPFSLANEMMGYWYFGYVWCELWKAIDVLLCTASIYSLCLISLDRYWSITRALHYSRQRTPKRAAIMIAFVWILSAMICVPPLIGWRQEHPNTDSGYPACLLSDEIGYVLYSSLGSFFIPCVLMVFVYARVYLAALSRARKNVKNPPLPVSQNGKKCKTITAITTSFVDKNPVTTGLNEGDGSSVMSEGEDSVYTQYNPQCDKLERKAAQNKANFGLILEESQQSRENAALNTEPNAKSVCISSSPHLIAYTGTDSSLDSSQNRADNYDIALKPNEAQNLLSIESDSAVQTDTPLVRHGGGAIAENTDTGIASTDCEQTHSKTHGIPLSNLKQLVSRKISRESGKAGNNEVTARGASQRDHDRMKRKIAKARERRATIVVGIVMAAFIMCWLPFFVLYLTAAICNYGFQSNCIHEFVFNFFFWLGYINSAFNPIIYTIFNRDFRHAFHKILFSRSRGRV